MKNRNCACKDLFIYGFPVLFFIFVALNAVAADVEEGEGSESEEPLVVKSAAEKKDANAEQSPEKIGANKTTAGGADIREEVQSSGDDGEGESGDGEKKESRAAKTAEQKKAIADKEAFDEEVAPEDVWTEEAEFYEEWIEGHFDVGVRYSTYEFERSKESSKDDEYFIGSIDSIEEEDPGFGIQNFVLGWYPLADSLEWLPESKRDKWHPFFAVIQGLGLELTWDELRAKTVTSPRWGYSATSDGTVVAKSMMLSYVLHIDNPTPVTPYFGMGSADYDDLSVTQGWWHYGFRSPEDYDRWIASGAEGDPAGGYRRTFTVDSAKGDFWYIGATVEVHEDWLIDIFYRETEVEFDNTYTMSDEGFVLETRYSKWDLSNTAYGFGIRCAF